MSSSDDGSGGRGRGRRGGGRRYHHGDLKAALVEAARSIIAEGGVPAVTVSEAARRAGATASALYNHFADREALIAEVAYRGFLAFAEKLETAWSDPALTPLQALDAQGRAYLAFAREDPAAFQTMFEAGLDMGATPELRAAAHRAFDALVRAVAAVIATAPEKERPPVLMVANHIRAFSHGVASLYARGGAPSTASAEDLLEAGVGIYLRGLGLLPKD